MDTKKLGFGLMRLPNDIEEVKDMVDLFIEQGFTYFDTAYVYTGSEDATKKALVDRYPRESYTLATKLCAWMSSPNEKAAKNQFYTSLKRTGAGYFDYYLLHALKDENFKSYDKYGIWDFVKEQKEKGLIKNVGFSFHSGPKLLEQILKTHPEMDFVQLQINYADWENPSVTSRANYEIARKYGKQIVVMEPVKGGALANPPKEVQKIMKDYNPNMSCASWAIRFAASLDGILTVLSGMSSIGQMEDNLSYMDDFQPLNEEEQKIIQQAQRILGNSTTIPCTSCHYCTAGCPKKIAIPEIFTAMNKHLGNGQTAQAISVYEKVTAAGNKASDCIMCKQCEQACPQNLPIIQYLKDCTALLER